MPKKGITLTDTDKGWNKLKTTVFYGKYHTHVDVGILEDPEMAKIASYNEFGTEHVPARSFIRAPFDAHQGYIKLKISLLKRVVAGRITLESALHILGAAVVKSFKKTIRDVILPLNAPSTEAKKGSDIPLIDTGKMYESISYRLNKK